MRLHALVALAALFPAPGRAAEPVLTPVERTIATEPAEDGWLRHVGLLDDHKYWRARITAFVPHENDLWIGTAGGRLLHLHEGKWTVEVDNLVQINGIAVESDEVVWLATTNGLRKLTRRQSQWENLEELKFHEGRPAGHSEFVPRPDGLRLWGYVEDIFLPRSERTYAPFVISESHGLFSFHYGVGLHFLPHYCGANSPWLDTTEVIPHRRPTQMAEDKEGNLWVGTRWDGLVRFNAHARAYHTRPPENNKEDGTEITKFGAAELGLEKLREVRQLKPGRESGVWAVVATGEGSQFLARFDGKVWSTLPITEHAKHVGELEFQLAVLSDDRVLVTAGGVLLEVTRADGELKERKSRTQRFSRLAVTEDGTVYGATYGKDVEHILQKRFE